MDVDILAWRDLGGPVATQLAPWAGRPARRRSELQFAEVDGKPTSHRLRILVIITVLAIVVIVTNDRWPEPPTDGSVPRPAMPLAERLAEFTGGLRPGGSYRPPTQEERDAAANGFALLLAGSREELAASDLTPLGFSVDHGVDEATGRAYLLVVNEPDSERAWGMYIVDLSAATRLAVEVPHPNSDLRTDEMGLELFRRVPGSVLLVAGAHRNAAGKAADVAHREDSIFHVVATAFASRGLLQVQLHGFDDTSLPAEDLVLSTGDSRAGAIAQHAALLLKQAGFAVCPAWRDECGQLAGTRNAQGRMAAQYGSPYLHIEASRTVREDASWRTTVIDMIEAALPIQ